MEQAFHNVASVSGVELPKDNHTVKSSQLSLPVKQRPSHLSKKDCSMKNAVTDDDKNKKHYGPSIRGIVSPSKALVSLSPPIERIKSVDDAASPPIQLTHVTRSASKVLQFGEGSTFAQSPTDAGLSDVDTNVDDDESNYV
jgi:hypothetical protein